MSLSLVLEGRRRWMVWPVLAGVPRFFAGMVIWEATVHIGLRKC